MLLLVLKISSFLLSASTAILIISLYLYSNKSLQNFIFNKIDLIEDDTEKTKAKSSMEKVFKEANEFVESKIKPRKVSVTIKAILMLIPYVNLPTFVFLSFYGLSKRIMKCESAYSNSDTNTH